MAVINARMTRLDSSFRIVWEKTQQQNGTGKGDGQASDLSAHSPRRGQDEQRQNYRAQEAVVLHEGEVLIMRSFDHLSRRPGPVPDDGVIFELFPGQLRQILSCPARLI